MPFPDTSAGVASLLENLEQTRTARTVRVMQGEEVLLETEVDEDALVVWDPRRGLLSIQE